MAEKVGKEKNTAKKQTKPKALYINVHGLLQQVPVTGKRKQRVKREKVRKEQRILEKLADSHRCLNATAPLRR